MTADDDAIRERLYEMRAMTARLSRRLRTSRSLLRELERCIDDVAELVDGSAAPSRNRHADEPDRRSARRERGD